MFSNVQGSRAVEPLVACVLEASIAFDHYIHHKTAANGITSLVKPPIPPPPCYSTQACMFPFLFYFLAACRRIPLPPPAPHPLLFKEGVHVSFPLFLPYRLPQNNPDKLSTIEETLARYRGRESVLFQRLEKQYGKPVPK